MLVMLVQIVLIGNQYEEASDEEEDSGRTKNHVLLEDLTSQETPLSEKQG